MTTKKTKIKEEEIKITTREADQVANHTMKMAETEATTATKATKAMAVDIIDNPTTIIMISTITITTIIMTIMAEMKLVTTEAMADTMNKTKIKFTMVAKEELEVNIRVRILKIIISIITTRIINKEKVDIKITITLGTEVSRIRRIKTLMKIELIITKGEMIKNNYKMTTKDINYNKISKNKPLPSSLTLTDQEFKLHKVSPSSLSIGTQTQ